jgi:uncharacterized protein YidB (DUF937 family)
MKGEFIMSYRKVSHEIKVKAVQECLKAENIKEIAEKHGISESTLRRECNRVINNVVLTIPGGPIDVFKKKLKKLRLRLFHR